MESEIISVNFVYSVTLKFIGLSCTLNDSFIHKYWETVKAHGGRQVCQNPGFYLKAQI